MGGLEAPPLRLVLGTGAVLELAGEAEIARGWYQKLSESQGPHPIIRQTLERVARGDAPSSPVKSAQDELGTSDIASGLSAEGAANPPWFTCNWQVIFAALGR